MRRLKAIFPFPRRLRGWLHLQGIPGTELEPPDVQPGDPGDPGDPGIVCDIEIISYETLNAPTGQEIKVATFIMNEEAQFLISIEEHDGQEPVFRLLDDQNEVVHDWQEETEFLVGLSQYEKTLTIQMKNKWQEVFSFEMEIKATSEQGFGFTGEPEEIFIQFDGWYDLECFGAQGGGNPSVEDHGGKGGKAKGRIYLTAGDILYIYVGEQGLYGVGLPATSNPPGGWNGGGNGGSAGSTSGRAGSSGGGATDIRLNGTDLENRIIVAGGGAGGIGTGTIVAIRDGGSGGGAGYYGGGGGHGTTHIASHPGTQNQGGSGAISSGDGSLGVGGNGMNSTTISVSGTNGNHKGGVGGGLVGGQGDVVASRGSAGSGGSSFIEMLEDGETESGVHEGDGLAKIEYLGLPDIEINNAKVVEDTEYTLTFDIVGALGGYETRIIHDGSPYNGVDWGTDTEFVFPLSMENEVITIEVKDVRDVVFSHDVTIIMIIEPEEFLPTHEFGSTGDIQTYTVPRTGHYRITAHGAQGGGTSSNLGGLGAKMSGTHLLNVGDVLQIIVGQRGVGSPDTTNPGGGGGSFVVKDGDLLLAAGGGAGAGNNDTGQRHATTDGAGKNGSGENQPGGENGEGGKYTASGTNRGAGGAGFLTDGEGSDAEGGKTYPVMIGGAGASDGDGGFGGGGGGGSHNNNGYGGGGGGYSGGGGGGWSGSFPTEGGGGGSFNSGTNQENEAGENDGAGKVLIEHMPM